MNQDSKQRYSLRTLLIVITLACLLFGLVGTRIMRARQEAARRNNLFQIALAFHNYHDRYGRFPPAYVADENGQLMHSWRVLLLEMMPDQRSQEIFERYDFTKPWNSPANMALAAEAPGVYANPLESGSSNKTSYMVVTGPGTLFEGAKNISFRNVIDGLSNTLLVAEVANSKTIWTEPRDLDVDSMPRDFQASNQAECISGLRTGEVMIATADAAIHYLDQALTEQTLRQILLRNDKSSLDRDCFKPVE